MRCSAELSHSIYFYRHNISSCLQKQSHIPFSSGESPKLLHQVNKFCIFQSYKSLEKDLRMRQANFAFPAKAQPSGDKNNPYLWPGSKCWIRAIERVFNTQRRKSQIWIVLSPEGVYLACGKPGLFNCNYHLLIVC